MEDSSFNLDFSKNLEKSIQKELEKEYEEQYELQNYSTSNSSLGEINDSFSTEDLKYRDKEYLEASDFSKKTSNSQNIYMIILNEEFLLYILIIENKYFLQYLYYLFQNFFPFIKKEFDMCVI